MFKVVKIISDKRIVINAGSSDVTEGDILRIIEKSSEEVKDPETGKVLGTLDYVKATICVEHVYKHMCICKNYETDIVNHFNVLENFGRYEITKSLNVDFSQITGGYETDNKKIVIGDLVEKMQ